MQLKPAKINDIDGMGMAQISTVNGVKVCKGHFIPNPSQSLSPFMSNKSLAFSGTVYDSGREVVLKFAIGKVDVKSGSQGEVIYFNASENPYSGQSK